MNVAMYILYIHIYIHNWFNLDTECYISKQSISGGMAVLTPKVHLIAIHDICVWSEIINVHVRTHTYVVTFSDLNNCNLLPKYTYACINKTFATSAINNWEYDYFKKFAISKKGIGIESQKTMQTS